MAEVPMLFSVVSAGELYSCVLGKAHFLLVCAHKKYSRVFLAARKKNLQGRR